MTGHKERRDSTDSDKENEFESLIQFPDNSNVLNLLPQVHKEKFFRNEESAIDSVRNIEENYAEENLDNLLTDLFNEDDGIIELPQPEEIGLASMPEASDWVSSVCSNTKNFYTCEPWLFNPFQNVNPVEDQKERDGELSTFRIMEGISTGGVTDVFVGHVISSVDEDIKRALELPASEYIDFLQGDNSENVDAEDLQDDDDIHQVLLFPGDQFEENPTKYEKIKVEPGTNDQLEETSSKYEEIKPEPLTNSTSEEEKEEEEEEEEDPPGVRTRGGRKRKLGTVVELLVSSYVRKRNTRCRVGANLFSPL